MERRYEILYHLGIIENEKQLCREEDLFECA